MEYIINLENAKTLWGFHEAIKKGLLLPNYYGMNMDALWDCLTGGDIDIPAVIHIKALNNLPKDLRKSGELLKQLLYEAKSWYSDINMQLDINEIS